MTTTIKNNIAIVHSNEVIITDGQSALDFIATVGYEHNVHKIAINKAAVTEDFFKLSTGLAGDIAQKFINYHVRFAIIGDFSGYTSKPLHDYIYECNQGKHLNFVATEEDAIRRLGK